jgi:hypothetical protein
VGQALLAAEAQVGTNLRQLDLAYELAFGRVALHAAETIATSNLIDAAVTTAKLADANVTTGKLADAAVTTLKLADNAVTNADPRCPQCGRTLRDTPRQIAKAEVLLCPVFIPRNQCRSLVASPEQMLGEVVVTASPLRRGA